MSITTKPNIVFIMADDMGVGDPGCYGSTKIQTPHIDKIASNGIKFTDAHAPSSMCTPSRYGVLTGQYCWRSPLKKSVAGNYAPPLIEKERLTVASMLKKQGYATACIGKWHLGLGWALKPGKELGVGETSGLPGHSWDVHESEKIDFTQTVKGGPLELGFDYFFGLSGSTNMIPFCFIENDRTVGQPEIIKNPAYDTDYKEGVAVPGWKTEDIGPALTEKAVHFIKDHHKKTPDKPFFLYLPTAAPHRPCIPPKFLRGKSQAGLRGDMVAEVDWTTGEVLKTLDELNLTENTLLIVTSDNGGRPGDPTPFIEELKNTSLGDHIQPPKEYLDGTAEELLEDVHCQHGWITYGHKSCNDWRGYKVDIWDGGHRIPFIAQWPGKIKPGIVTDELICLTDFMATCSAITGASLPENVAEDSFNILPVLKGVQLECPVHEAIVHHSGHGMFSIRQDKWKLILGRGSGGESRPLTFTPKPDEAQGQLYDMISDPGEKNNVWLDNPDIVKKLTIILDKFIEQGRSR